MYYVIHVYQIPFDDKYNICIHMDRIDEKNIE